jgi:hypothetical protein
MAIVVPSMPPAAPADSGFLLDPQRLAAVDPVRFRATQPYPWVGLDGPLTDAGYASLRALLPPLQIMQASFGRRRAHGQHPHDRYVLEYTENLPVAEPWHRLVAEFEADPYRSWLAELFGTRRIRLNFHWHYTPNGCSVSPHCDARHKLGSHIFYFNTAQDWEPAWGGETLILDDGGRLRRNSAPGFADFARSHSAPALGNRSLLFRRQGNSWHGVKPIDCPPGMLRKVFIVVINSDTLVDRWRRRLR